MLRNYVKSAVRSLINRSGHSLLNIAGLAIGMTCCILIFQYVAFQLSFDSHHEKADRLYRVVRETTQNNERLPEMVWTGWGEAPAYAEDVPEMERYARVHVYFGGPILSPVNSPDVTVREESAYFVDPAFLNMFTVPFVGGDPTSALTRPHTLLISESTARKYFGTVDAVGEIFRIRGGWAEGDYSVVGVFEDVPPMSHLQPELLFPMQDLLASERYSNPSTAWSNDNFYTYVEVRKGADVRHVEALMTESYISRNRDALESLNRTATMRLEPLRDIHLNADIGVPGTITANRKTVYFFGIVALLTLVIALINYVNLSTARALDRAREVAVRKVVGASRRQLITQYLFESALTNAAALCIAIVLSFSLLPVVNRLADVAISSNVWTNVRFWIAFVLAFGAGTLLSGLYPAFLLSAVKPVAILKGNVGALASRSTLRRVLVVAQFAASVGLLVGTLVVYSQVSYMRNMNLGLQLDQVLVFKGPPTAGDGSTRYTTLNTLKQELSKSPGIEGVTQSGTVPGQGFTTYSYIYRAEADPSTQRRGQANAIDPDFLDVYGLDLVAGEPFTESAAQFSEGSPLPALVNETAVSQLGFASAETALGNDVLLGGNEFQIQGVLRDFKWTSAHEENSPILFYPVSPSDPGGTFSARVGGRGAQETVTAVQDLYKHLFPDSPFEYFFADQEFEKLYRNDQRFARLFGLFAGLAILIACLGLFGLASYTAQQRTKEIGVRKVLGASVHNVVVLLAKEFLLLVFVGFIIAAPLAYLGMQRWLENFAYRIEISAWVFVMSGLSALLIALLTVGYQSIKAATADPVASLRYE